VARAGDNVWCQVNQTGCAKLFLPPIKMTFRVRLIFVAAFGRQVFTTYLSIMSSTVRRICSASGTKLPLLSSDSTLLAHVVASVLRLKDLMRV